MHFTSLMNIMNLGVHEIVLINDASKELAGIKAQILQIFPFLNLFIINNIYNPYMYIPYTIYMFPYRIYLGLTAAMFCWL